MKRREFIALLGGAAVAWPLAARAQQAMPVIGFLHSSSLTMRREQVAAFQRGLSEAGFVEGRNVAIEYRWAENQYARLPELAGDLVRRRVKVIVAPGGAPATRAAKMLTTTTPIVFSTSIDPVEAGLVASLNRPEGNVTGITDMGVDVVGKQVGLLHELLPGAVRFGLLVNPGGALAELTRKEVQTTASAMGCQVDVLGASTKDEIDAAFRMFTQKRIDALLVSPNILFSSRRVQLAMLAMRSQLPAAYASREYAEAGGLMSYGSSITDREYQLGIYTGRILKGEKPADLPILRASKFELVINQQTAKLLGLDVPATLLARADEVIE